MDIGPSNPTPPLRRDRQSRWLAIIAKTRRGPAAALARAGLTVLAGLYRAGLALANLRWRLPGAVHRAPCPVVSVGNLTVGGTGKTPMVAYLARLALAEGARPLIVSRGYGAAGGRPNEEALELAEACPDVPQVRSPDRLGTIRAWTASEPCDLAILDDGFQHRRLARDLDIVLVDTTRPFGFGHVLPRGLLREPPSALARADLVVITRAELLTAEGVARLKTALEPHLRPETPVLVSEHRPSGVVLLDGTRRDADWLRGRKVTAACGIANPDAFEQGLDRLGAHVVRFEAFRDHYAYAPAEIDRLIDAARLAGAEALVTTRKDFVKWRPLLEGRQDDLPVTVAALGVDLAVTEGEDVLRRRLLALLPASDHQGER